MPTINQSIDSPLLTTPIENEKLIGDIWNKYFADKHASIVNNLRLAFKTDPKLYAALTQAFPAFTWPEFADMPKKNSFNDLKATLDKVLSVSGIKALPAVVDAINAYSNQFQTMVNKITSAPAKMPAAQQQPVVHNNLPSKDKVKQLQSLLNANPTGVWDKYSNDLFLAWLRDNGWSQYIKNERYTGNLNDAIRTLLMERAAPGKPSFNPGELEGRQAKRLELLKKIGE